MFFMITAGVRELKARLSTYLREVQAGEVVLVTDRKRVVAELRRPGSQVDTADLVNTGLRRLVERGTVRLPSKPGDRTWLEPTGIRLPRTVVKALLDAERDE